MKKSTLITIAVIAFTLVAVAALYSDGLLAFLSALGQDDTPIKAIASDPARYDGRNVTVIGSLGSRETTTLLRSSLTIVDREGFYLDLLKPVPSWLKYEIEMPFIITGTFTHYDSGSIESLDGPPEEGYGLIPLSIEKVFNFVH